MSYWLTLFFVIAFAGWIKERQEAQRLREDLVTSDKLKWHFAYLLNRAEARNTRLHNRLACVRAAVETSLHKDLNT